MKQSALFYKTSKETPKEETSSNARLLLKAGFLHKEMSGVWSFLPLGLRVLRKIEKIIREEIDAIGGQEILMTVLQPKSLWEETNRWNEGIGDVMYKVKEGEKEIGLGPTHEEMITDIVRKNVKSWQDLPLKLYQIQTKFRKEPRAKSGLLRGREFGMKDLYSFHATEEDFKSYYEQAKKAYSRIFERCGLKAIVTEASGAGFTKDCTHEFQVEAEGGEDWVVRCPAGHFAKNKEVSDLKKGDKCPACSLKLEEVKTIEVGNIFPLGKKYSEQMNAFFTDEEGKKKGIIMGCYGIGTTRVMGAAVEVWHDEKGIIWPEEISPFNVHLILLSGDLKVREISEKIYDDLQGKGLEVLYDDRENKSPGEKLVESDLIGIPLRLVVSDKTVSQDSAEIKERSGKEIELVKFDDLARKISSLVKANVR